MKRSVLFLTMFTVLCLLFTSCDQKAEKTDPISVIEKLSQDVDKNCDSWDKAAWDEAADRLQAALDSLTQPIDTTQINLTSALESLLMNVHAHERQAIKMLQVLKPYEDLKKSGEELAEEPDESVTLVGSIEELPITMNLDFYGNRVKGSYYYDKKGPGSKLTLTGTLKKGVLNLVEKNGNDETTGHFHGEWIDSSYLGTFTDSKGRQRVFALADKDIMDGMIVDDSFSDDYGEADYEVNQTGTTANNTQTSAAARDAQIDAYEALVNKFIAAMNKVANGDMDAYDEYNSLKKQIESFEIKKEYSQAQHNRINRIAQRYKDRLKELGGL